jgi:hypothetical protein
MRVRVICSLRLLGCFPRVETSAGPGIRRSRAEALSLDRVTRRKAYWWTEKWTLARGPVLPLADATATSM